jgi:hypothetical protein
MNALKHGNRSRKVAMLHEESYAFEERLRKWMAIGDTQNDSFGSGVGPVDRVERAEMIDLDGVEQHGDPTSGIGEIGENAPNEPNFAETMSIVEAPESIQVTANSGALSRLDKGMTQPGKDSTPDDGKAPGPASSR